MIYEYIFAVTELRTYDEASQHRYIGIALITHVTHVHKKKIFCNKARLLGAIFFPLRLASILEAILWEIIVQIFIELRKN